MPPRFGGAPKCPKCNKSVYQAEQVLGAGKAWHRMCFVCSTCNKMVSSTTLAEHEGKLFCKTCHGKQFGPKGYGFAGGAATVMREEAHSRPAQPTPAYTQQHNPAPSRPAAAAAAGSSYGGNVRPAQPGPAHSTLAARKQSYSASLRQIAPQPEAQRIQPNNRAAPNKNRFGGAPACQKCGKSVYAAEEVKAAGNTYHKLCFSCTQCNKLLALGEFIDHDRALYCKACHGKNFGPKGYGHQGSGTAHQVMQR